MKPSRILVPVKPGSDVSMLDSAYATAAALRAELVFVSVAEPAGAAVEGRVAALALDVLRERKTLAQHSLRDAAARAAGHGLQATTVVEAGNVPEALARAAQEQRCDLVLFSVGRQGKLSQLTHHLVDALLQRRAGVLIVPADAG